MSELDEYLGPRAYDPTSVGPVTAADMTGDYEPPEKEAVLDVAHMLCRMLANPVEYVACGDDTRQQARQCASRLLKNARGDVEGVKALEELNPRTDGEWTVKGIRASTNLFALRKKLSLLYDQRRAARPTMAEMFDQGHPEYRL